MNPQLILFLPIIFWAILYYAHYRSTLWEPTGRKRWRVKYESENHILSVYEREWINIKSGKIKWIKTNGSDIKLKENNNDTKD
jgi:hypothetical protein